MTRGKEFVPTEVDSSFALVLMYIFMNQTQVPFIHHPGCSNLHNCTSTNSSNITVKFAENTYVLGLISNNEWAYLEEVETLWREYLRDFGGFELITWYWDASEQSTTTPVLPLHAEKTLKLLLVHLREHPDRYRTHYCDGFPETAGYLYQAMQRQSKENHFANLFT